MFTSRIFEYIWPDFDVIKRTIVEWLSSSFTWVRSSVWSTPAPSLWTQPESKVQTTWSPSTRTDRQQGRDHKPTYRRSQEEGREASQALLKQNKRLRRWKMSRKSKLSCGAMLQVYKVTRWQIDKVTRWQGDNVTTWQGYKVTLWQGDKESDRTNLQRLPSQKSLWEPWYYHLKWTG